jgi:hypothetical protein
MYNKLGLVVLVTSVVQNMHSKTKIAYKPLQVFDFFQSIII